MSRVPAISWAAAAACALAVALNLQSAWTLPASYRSIRQKAETLEELRELDRGQAQGRAAIGMFERLPNRSPAPLGDLVRAILPDAPCNVRERDARTAAEGWTVRSTEVSFDRLRLEDLGRLLERAESQAASAPDQRPPWRLAECTIASSDTSPGSGRVNLVFEALEKGGGVR